MDNLLKILPEILRLSGNQEDVCEKAVFATWNSLVGEQVRRNAAPMRLHKKTLFIAARDATWRHQLEKMSGQMLFKLNSILGGAYVTLISFRVNPAAFENVGRKAPEIEFHHLAEHEAELAPQAAKIKDRNLRETFLRAASKMLDRREQ